MKGIAYNSITNIITKTNIIMGIGKLLKRFWKLFCLFEEKHDHY